MRLGLCAAVAAVVAMTTAVSARALMVAMPMEVPSEVVATEADVIVSATITELPKAPEAPAAVPAPNGKPMIIRRPINRGLAGPMKFKVSKVYVDRVKADVADKEIEVTTNVMAGMGAAAPKVGDKVVMALKQNGGKYVTLGYANAYQADGTDAAKALIKSADLDGWNWGKESSGLKAAAFTTSVFVNPANDKATMQVCLAVRNVGKGIGVSQHVPGGQLPGAQGVLGRDAGGGADGQRRECGAVQRAGARGGGQAGRGGVAGAVGGVAGGDGVCGAVARGQVHAAGNV